jgi:hypothetical protein
LNLCLQIANQTASESTSTHPATTATLLVTPCANEDSWLFTRLPPELVFANTEPQLKRLSSANRVVGAPKKHGIQKYSS